ncbi:MAG: ATP-binding cassette domain-containing protein [Actinomycetia bacterium]|nr:ATP-binding cassette domain-containing protein [Actinomycetes bacterium]
MQSSVKSEHGETARTPVIEVRGAAKSYGSIRALDGIDFAMNPGEVHALVGDNGAGKSTLLKILSGAIKPTAGTIYMDGRRVNLDNPQDSLDLGVATVYQDLALVPVLPIPENIFLGREPTRYGFVQRRRMVRAARDLFESLGQMNIRNIEASVADLSGGQRQAVALARAIHGGGRALLLDEPTAALGVRESEAMLELIESLKTPQHAIVIVSHNLAHVFRVSDRITVLRRGVKAGTAIREGTTTEEIVSLMTGATSASGEER